MLGSILLTIHLPYTPNTKVDTPYRSRVIISVPLFSDPDPLLLNTNRSYTTSNPGGLYLSPNKVEQNKNSFFIEEWVSLVTKLRCRQKDCRRIEP